MAKREFIDRNEIQWYGCDFESFSCRNKECKDCAHGNASRNEIFDLPVFTEQDIVKPYLDKLKARLVSATMDNYFMPVNKLSADEITDIIDNFLSEQGDTE